MPVATITVLRSTATVHDCHVHAFFGMLLLLLVLMVVT